MRTPWSTARSCTFDALTSVHNVHAKLSGNYGFSRRAGSYLVCQVARPSTRIEIVPVPVDVFCAAAGLAGQALVPSAGRHYQAIMTRASARENSDPGLSVLSLRHVPADQGSETPAAQPWKNHVTSRQGCDLTPQRLRSVRS